MPPDDVRARHRAPVALNPRAEAARYLLERRRTTRLMLLAALSPALALWAVPVPVGAYAAVCLLLTVLLVLCALSQDVRFTMVYGTALSLVVALVGRRLGAREVEVAITAASMLVLTTAAAGGSRMWAAAHEVLAERLRISNGALSRANERLREANTSLERRVAERTMELRELAQRDELTGLYNRRHFIACLDEAIRLGDPVGVVMIDADDFKVVNDTFGHPTGDRVLQILAASMRGVVRSQDVLARIGGEEFAILLTDGDAAMRARLAERVRAGVEAIAWPADLPLPNGRVTVSVGHAGADGALAPTAVLQGADAALYAAKRAGRNRVRGDDADG